MTDDDETLAGAVRDGRTLPARSVGAPAGLISERYAVDGLLGRGGMGVVLAAWDRVLDRPVALKVIRGDTGGGGEHLVREARAMARLSHPNIVPVYDAGVSTDGTVYVAMERVTGVTLARWLHERAPDAAAILDAFAAAGRGLAAAHAAGVVHRDFKPENVMVGDDGRVRVLDFGLAALDAGAGAVVGTPRYMSPEQWRGEDSDGRADQFGFCIALAEALGGAHPFGDRRDAVLAGAPRLAEPIPGWLVPALRRGLAPRPEERFPTMDALVAALTAPPPRRRRWKRMAVAATAVLFGGVALAIARPPAAAAGFRCGPNVHTYAVRASGDARGVRCVRFARDRDGALWLAWYGEGVVGGVPYRQLGEGRLGGPAIAADLAGDVDDPGAPFDDTLRLDAAAADTPPPRIVAGGVRDETWLLTDGRHAGYTSAFTAPVRACGDHLTRYRVYPKIEGSWGFSVACVTPSGRTWLSAGAWARDPFMALGTIGDEDGAPQPRASNLCLPRIPCGAKAHGRHGAVAMRPRAYPGVGDGLELSGLFPELWMPWTRRHAVRIHAVRVVDDGAPDQVPVTAADLARAVRRANQLLAAAGIEVFFIVDDDGRDVETLLASMVGEATAAALRDEHPYKVIVWFRAGGQGGCAPHAPDDALVLAPVGEGDCATPWDDRLAHALAAHLGLGGIPDGPLSPDQDARLHDRIRALRLE